MFFQKTSREATKHETRPSSSSPSTLQSPLHLQCPRRRRWRRPRRSMSRKPAPVAAPPSLSSVTPSSSSSRSPLDSTLPSPRACRRCSPSRRQRRDCLCRLWPPALAQAAWNCSTRSRPQPRGWQLALRLAGSADAAQGLLGAAAQLHPWRQYVEVVMAQQRRQQQGQGHVQDVVPRHALTTSPPSLPGLK